MTMCNKYLNISTKYKNDTKYGQIFETAVLFSTAIFKTHSVFIKAHISTDCEMRITMVVKVIYDISVVLLKLYLCVY